MKTQNSISITGADIAASTVINTKAKLWALDNLEYLNNEGPNVFSSSVKLEKGSKKYASLVVYLQPADKVAALTLCVNAESAGCKKPCLIISGHLGMAPAQSAATRRTIIMLMRPDYFTERLLLEIDRAERKAVKTGIPALFRLNGTSDVSFTYIIDARPDSMFYDYSKSRAQLRRGSVRANYDVTYSGSMFSEQSRSALRKAVLAGDRIAMAFNTKGLKSDTLDVPAQLLSFDVTDLRHLDPVGSIGSLTAKGTNKVGRAALELVSNSFFVTSANLQAFNAIIGE
jgi:hypothetical protein